MPIRTMVAAYRQKVPSDITSEGGCQMRPDRDDDFDARPGREDVPGESLSVVRTGEGHVLLLPSAYRRMNGEQREIVAELQDIAATMARLSEELEEIVGQARDAGISWDMVGWSIGRTGRAASMRFGGDRSG